MIQWIKTDMLQLKLFWKSFIQQMLFYLSFKNIFSFKF